MNSYETKEEVTVAEKKARTKNRRVRVTFTAEVAPDVDGKRVGQKAIKEKVKGLATALYDLPVLNPVLDPAIDNFIVTVKNVQIEELEER